MSHLKGFAAGFIATLVFHQGLLWLLHAVGVSPFAAYNFQPVPPLGIPQVLSLAFWGGVWGVALAWVLQSAAGARYWTLAVVLGALGPSIVAWCVVMPMKGMGIAGGGDPKIIVGALLLNAAWGLGLGLLLKAMAR